MSTKKLIQEISMMTHKGIYPSLNILLEKDEGDESGEETPTEMGDEVLDEPETPSTSEDNENTEDTEDTDDIEDTKDTETPSEPKKDDDSINQLELTNIASDVGEIKQVLDRQNNPTDVEDDLSESFRKNYFNLKKFTLLQEDSSSIVADIQDVLDQFEKKNGFGLDDIKGKLLKGEDINLNFMLDRVKKELSKPFDVALAILKDELETIRRKAKPEKIEELQIKFIEMFEEYCHKNNINVTIPEKYKKIKPSNYDVAQGAVKSG